jgi:hypothetical protein
VGRLVAEGTHVGVQDRRTCRRAGRYLAGQLLELLREATAAHRTAVQKTSKAVAAYNRWMLEGVARRLHGGKVGSSRASAWCSTSRRSSRG